MSAFDEYTPASSNTRPKRNPSHPGRVDFNIKEFEDAIEDQGTWVRITPSVLCPNRTGLHDTNHVLDCPLCGGDEVIDLTAKAVETWALITAIKLNKQMEVPGIFDLKDAQMTVPPEVKLYYWYKVEILDFGSLFNQIIKRGTGNVDKLRYIPFAATDMEFNLIDSAGQVYEKDTHFTVAGREITWTTLTRPVSGKLYSISYPINPTFRVLEMLHENRYYYKGFKIPHKVPVQLPQQAAIRLDYLAKGQGANTEK